MSCRTTCYSLLKIELQTVTVTTNPNFQDFSKSLAEQVGLSLLGHNLEDKLAYSVVL